MLSVFDYDIDDGILSNKRPFADLRNIVGRPDGAAVDTDGCYWAVSYTHLDVYKRQVQGDGRK